MKLLRRGKVKDVYEVDGETLEFVFSNRVSVFDKIVPTQIPNKGEALCRTSTHWFKVAGSMDIENHFKEMTSGNKMRVRKFQIFDRLDAHAKNCIIPLEFVSRHYVAGSLYDRLEKGDLDPKSVGLDQGKNLYGKKLPQPVVEVTTKFEKFDRKLDIEEAMDISGLTKDEFKNIEETVLKIDERIDSEVGKRGLTHVDGKKEFGLDNVRNIVIVDTFGTADEDRFWDSKRHEEGECLELSKEFVRQYYRNIKYYEELTTAREKSMKEPDIPPLPEDMIMKVDNLYVDMFERITGERFRG